MKVADLPPVCEGDIRLPIPREFRRGRWKADERRSIESAVTNLKAIAVLTERPDWSRLNVLDYGCGVKFTQALIQYAVDVQAYVGMDVFAPLVHCLAGNVLHPNFSFHTVPFRNEMYNPGGSELDRSVALPGSLLAYDLITLQSVFTHFNPRDFQALLHVLRRYAGVESRMFFTCFIDNSMSCDYRDLVPEHALLKACYSENAVRRMLEKADWRLLSHAPRSSQMQNQFVCEPC